MRFSPGVKCFVVYPKFWIGARSSLHNAVSTGKIYKLTFSPTGHMVSIFVFFLSFIKNISPGRVVLFREAEKDKFTIINLG